MKFIMELTEVADARKYWSGWGARQPQGAMRVKNFLSAVVLAMSTFVLVANHMT